MPGLVPGIYALKTFNKSKTWMAGTSAAMTCATHVFAFGTGGVIARLACFWRYRSRRTRLSHFGAAARALGPERAAATKQTAWIRHG